MKIKVFVKKIVTALLLCTMVCGFVLPLLPAAKAEDEHKTVRVGWYNSSFNYYDSFGRRRGIDYEYQQKIAAYTGWEYEYVEDSWSNLFKMLKNGEIDMLGDVSFTPYRDGYVLYPDLPMGTESYYVFVSSDNTEISSDNPKSLNGKRVGINADTVQEELFEEWAKKNNVSVETVQISLTETESIEMVVSGEIDAYASIYTYDSDDSIMPVFRIGGSDYYYAISKSRPDLLDELNAALAKIHDEDPYFNQKLSEEGQYNIRNNAIISPIQEEWLKNHGTIKIGYRDDYLPFCDKDDKTGELTGALKDFLVHAENSLNSSNVKFETIPYESTEKALEALAADEIDCVFPVYFNTYDADQMSIRLTEPAMKTEMYAVMRQSDRQVLTEDSEIVLAVNEGMVNVETFIKDLYPNCEMEYYKGLDACYKAVSDKKADCVLVSNYRIPYAEDTFRKYKLCSVPVGEAMPFSFAVEKWDTELYFLMNKAVLTTKSEDMDAALAYYMNANSKVSVTQFLRDYMYVILAVMTVIFAIIIFLLVQKIKVDKVANRQKKLLEEASAVEELKQTVSSLLDNMPGMNFTKDAETGVYLACNQAFAEYANKKSPDEVIGLTPDRLFDPKLAKSSVEDDKVALSMDGPYIFYDYMPDVNGNRTQYKITKLKYTDNNNRLCVLGMLQDVTDTFRISRDSAGTKEGYEKARNSGIIFSSIAQALAHGYTDLYYVDLNTEEFMQYRTDDETGTLEEVCRGWHFFEEWQDESDEKVFAEDRDAVKKAMDRKTLVAELDRGNAFMMTYRINGENGPTYVSMKVTRLQEADNYIIIGITDVDEQMTEHNTAAKMKEERIAYNRISALAGDFFCIYIVNPETGQYRVFSSTAGFDTLDLPEEGFDFFAAARERTANVVYLEDQSRFISMMTIENVLDEVKRDGLFNLSYRLKTDGEPRYVRLKAAMVDEPEGARLIVGINDIDAQVRQEEEYGRRLAQARIEANIDALTGVKNRNAYRIYEERLNAQIEVNRAPEFAIIILDVNDLKKVNDTEGHKAGDQYLRDASRIVCTTFKRSPVFRVGGDEFAVIAQGDDYNRIDELMTAMNNHNEEALKDGGIVIAIGMARYEKEPRVAAVYERADKTMYENKTDLKSRKK